MKRGREPRRAFAPMDAVIIAAGLALFALLPGAGLDGSEPDRVIVTVGDDSALRTYPLYPDREFTVAGPLGESVVRLEEGSAQVISSPCPNKICVRMGRAEKSGQVLVCVPNRVSLKLSSGGDEGLDAVAR